MSQDIVTLITVLAVVVVAVILFMGLWNMFRGGDAKCLESSYSTNASHDGASFMVSCQNVSGQKWKLVADASGYRLKSMFQGDNKCLDANDPASSFHNGSVYMADCQSTYASQSWDLVEALPVGP